MEMLRAFVAVDGPPSVYSLCYEVVSQVTGTAAEERDSGWCLFAYPGKHHTSTAHALITLQGMFYV